MLFLEQESFDDTSVLLALEHPTSAQLLSDRLGRRGLRTQHVQDGKDALKITRNASVDVMVAQSRLPGHTGLELLREVPHLDPAVVLVGREGNDDEIVRAFEFGAADYIARPFAPNVAVARILRFARMPAAVPDTPSR